MEGPNFPVSTSRIWSGDTVSRMRNTPVLRVVTTSWPPAAVTLSPFEAGLSPEPMKSPKHSDDMLATAKHEVSPNTVDGPHNESNGYAGHTPGSLIPLEVSLGYPPRTT